MLKKGPALYKGHTGYVRSVKGDMAVVSSDVDGKDKHVKRHECVRIDSRGNRILNQEDETDKIVKECEEMLLEHEIKNSMEELNVQH